MKNQLKLYKTFPKQQIGRGFWAHLARGILGPGVEDFLCYLEGCRWGKGWGRWGGWVGGGLRCGVFLLFFLVLRSAARPVLTALLILMI